MPFTLQHRDIPSDARWEEDISSDDEIDDESSADEESQKHQIEAIDKLSTLNLLFMLQLLVCCGHGFCSCRDWRSLSPDGLCCMYLIQLQCINLKNMMIMMGRPMMTPA